MYEYMENRLNILPRDTKLWESLLKPKITQRYYNQKKQMCMQIWYMHSYKTPIFFLWPALTNLNSNGEKGSYHFWDWPSLPRFNPLWPQNMVGAQTKIIHITNILKDVIENQFKKWLVLHNLVTLTIQISFTPMITCSNMANFSLSKKVYC